MTDDVVAELEAELALYPLNKTVQRARDEIVALRSTAERRLSMVQDANRCIEETQALLVAVRDEALEEAARVCELSAEIMQPDERRLGEAIAAVKSCAAAIRALKGER